MTKRVCTNCGGESKDWYGSPFSDGCERTLCLLCFKVKRKEYEEWYEGLSPGEKKAHCNVMLRRAGIIE